MTPEPGALTFERFLPHAPQKVWRALTDGRLLEGWLLPGDFQAVVGHRFELRAPPLPGWNGVITGEVRAVHPFEHLAYTWNTARNGETDTLATTVTWTLSSVEGGTLVCMEQRGFRTDRMHAQKGANQAWPLFLDNLERLLSQPLGLHSPS